jgi:hypothetical protein
MATDVEFLPHPTVTTLRPSPEARRNDAALGAVIAGKPRNDEVPRAVWWLLAECLGYSVTVRREAAMGRDRGSSDFGLTMREARFAAGRALDQLDEPTGARRPCATEQPGQPRAATSSLRMTVQDLAGLIVTRRATTRVELRRAIHVHLDALWHLDHPVSQP